MLNKLATGASYAKEQLALLGEQAAEQHAQITRQAQEFAAKAEESLQLGRETRYGAWDCPQHNICHSYVRTSLSPVCSPA